MKHPTEHIAPADASAGRGTSRSNPDRSVATPIDRASNAAWTFQGGCILPK
jgi:hypothetical protein